MSGPAVFGGAILQARAAAYVAVHILARAPLRWAEIGTPDRPVAVAGEVPGPGDDLRIQIAGTNVELDVQCKRGLNRARLIEWSTLVATRLRDADRLRVVLAVDPDSLLAIRTHFRNDLRQLRDGFPGDRHEVTEAVRNHMAGICGGHNAADALLSRVDVVVLHLDHDWSESRKTAIEMLRRVLQDGERADDAWCHIESECHQLCRDRRRRDYEAWARLLNSRNIHLRSAPPSTCEAAEPTGGAAPAGHERDVQHGSRGADPTPPEEVGAASHDDPQPPPLLDYGVTAYHPQRLGTWRALRAALRGMTAGEVRFTRLTAAAALMSTALTIPGVALWDLSSGLHQATVAFGCGTAITAALALTPVGRRTARLRHSVGVPCPSGCGGAWPALDAAEVFRAYGHLGEVQREWSAWVPCPVYGADPAHRVAVAWPLAYGEMLDALNGYRLDAERAAVVLNMSQDPADQTEARESRHFASNVATLFNEGVAGVADDALLANYDRLLGLYAGHQWPRRDREALFRLIVALEIRAALQA